MRKLNVKCLFICELGSRRLIYFQKVTFYAVNKTVKLNCRNRLGTILR